MEENLLLSVTDGILQVVNEWEGRLLQLAPEVITGRVNSQQRTVKQILGHLIDSASNNHQRMVRLQYHKELHFPDYRQDNDCWIAIQHYQDTDWYNLVQLWKFYNLHIIQVIRSADTRCLTHYWTDFEGTRVTLQEMIEGYLWHLHLHMNEIGELI